MVNTMVKDPKLRKLNWKLDRQKKSRMHQSGKLLRDPDDAFAPSSIDFHTKKIDKLKRQKELLRSDVVT